jgi:hypothetical protein
VGVPAAAAAGTATVVAKSPDLLPPASMVEIEHVHVLGVRERVFLVLILIIESNS